MTPRLITLTAVFGLAASAACAEDTTNEFAAIDADGSGNLSLTEIQAAAPEVTATEFIAYDSDGSGDLSAEEFAAWKAEKQMN